MEMWCASCDHECGLMECFIIEGDNGQDWYVCCSLCVDNFIESMVDFPELAEIQVEVRRVVTA